MGVMDAFIREIERDHLCDNRLLRGTFFVTRGKIVGTILCNNKNLAEKVEQKAVTLSTEAKCGCHGSLH